MRLVCVSLLAAAILGTLAGGDALLHAAQGAGGQSTGPAPGRGSATPGLPPSRGTGLLMGQVVDGATGRPISDAIVQIGPGGAALGSGPSVAPPIGRGASGSAQQRVLVDAQGRFLFRDLAAGPVTLLASKPGYFGGASGQVSPRGRPRPVELADAERMGGVTLRLWPYATISGTIFDDAGAPVTGVNVQLLRRGAVNGRWQFSAGSIAQTDDRGVYRFGTIGPGDYVVGVRSDGLSGERLIMSLIMSDEAGAMKMLPKIVERGEESMLIDSSVKMYPETFYPGISSSSQATVISVEPGAERRNVDFRVTAVPARTVAGRLTGQGLDRATASVNLRLRAADAGSVDNDLSARTASMDTNGRFVFSTVPPGQYILEAVSRPRRPGDGSPVAVGRGSATGGTPLPPAPDAPTFFAAMPVTVGDKNISDLELTLAASGRVSGRVEFDGADRPTDEALNQIFVTLDPVDSPVSGQIQRGRVEADGTFRTASVPPGRYLLRVGSLSMPASTALAPGAAAAVAGAGAVAGGGTPGQPRVWRPRSATINGRDPLDQPLELDLGDITSVLVTFTDKPAVVLSGTVRDAKGDSDPQAVVLVFPTDNRLWNDFSTGSRRIKTTRTSRYGVYSIAGLPAGEYFIVVGTDDQFIDMQAPGALETYTRLATRVMLVDGVAKTLDLKSGGR